MEDEIKLKDNKKATVLDLFMQMSRIICKTTNCRYNFKGGCTRKIVKIIDGQCEKHEKRIKIINREDIKEGFYHEMKTKPETEIHIKEAENVYTVFKNIEEFITKDEFFRKYE